MEMLILVLILGIALPAIVSVIGIFSHYHVNNQVRMTAAHLANSKMEEILAFKHHSWDWFKSIQKFDNQESLAEGYTRKTTIQKVSQWGQAKIDAYEVKVEILHSQLSNQYLLTMRLSKYH